MEDLVNYILRLLGNASMGTIEYLWTYLGDVFGFKEPEPPEPTGREKTEQFLTELWGDHSPLIILLVAIVVAVAVVSYGDRIPKPSRPMPKWLHKIIRKVKRTKILAVPFRDWWRGVDRCFHAHSFWGFVLRVVVAWMVLSIVPTSYQPTVVVVGLWVVGYLSRPRGKHWWSHKTLHDALTQAGVLPTPKDGERAQRITYLGRPQHTEHGTTVIVGLPNARTLADVKTNRERLAAGLRIPTSRLEVHQNKADPAHVVRLTVSHPASGVTAATLSDAEATTWTTPIRIGRDARGQAVTFATDENNSLVAGIPGTGKTSLARFVLAHYLLDPTTLIYALDGKGSRKDYGACRSLCTRFVFGTEDAAPADTLEMLTEVLALIQTRNSSGSNDHPGVLVFLEEFQDVRAGAPKADRDQLDNVLARIVRMGRAVSVHVLVSTQRPTVEDLPSGVRNLMTQRLALMVSSPEDARIVLGLTPTLPLPTERGQALYRVGGPERAVVLDRLTDDAWGAVCDRAKALRAERPETAPLPADTTAAVTLAPTPSSTAGESVLDPVVDAVLSVLADSDPRGLSSTVLHERLPGWVQDTYPTSQRLGVALAKHPDMFERKSNNAGARLWKAAASAPPVSRQPTASKPPVQPPAGGQNGLDSRSNQPVEGIGVRQ